jgi:hypothetical protein
VAKLVLELGDGLMWDLGLELDVVFGCGVELLGEVLYLDVVLSCWCGGVGVRRVEELCEQRQFFL